MGMWYVVLWYVPFSPGERGFKCSRHVSQVATSRVIAARAGGDHAHFDISVLSAEINGTRGNTRIRLDGGGY